MRLVKASLVMMSVLVGSLALFLIFAIRGPAFSGQGRGPDQGEPASISGDVNCDGFLDILLSAGSRTVFCEFINVPKCCDESAERWRRAPHSTRDLAERRQFCNIRLRC